MPREPRIKNPQDFESEVKELRRAVETLQAGYSYYPPRTVIINWLARIQLHTLEISDSYGIHASEIAKATVEMKQALQEASENS